MPRVPNPWCDKHQRPRQRVGPYANGKGRKPTYRWRCKLCDVAADARYYQNLKQRPDDIERYRGYKRRSHANLMKRPEYREHRRKLSIGWYNAHKDDPAYREKIRAKERERRREQRQLQLVREALKEALTARRETDRRIAQWLAVGTWHGESTQDLV